LWGVLEHRGRTSGRTYHTPLVIREVPGGFVIPVPFGPGTQWVKNIEWAGEASIRWDGRDHHVVEPEQIDLQAAETAFSGFQRFALVRSGIDSFVRVRVAPGT
jgi:deazaflavin-dependent oxidoreductase (nitroreductase family)